MLLFSISSSMSDACCEKTSHRYSLARYTTFYLARTRSIGMDFTRTRQWRAQAWHSCLPSRTESREHFRCLAAWWSSLQVQKDPRRQYSWASTSALFQCYFPSLCWGTCPDTRSSLSLYPIRVSHCRNIRYRQSPSFLRYAFDIHLNRHIPFARFSPASRSGDILSQNSMVDYVSKRRWYRVERSIFFSGVPGELPLLALFSHCYLNILNGHSYPLRTFGAKGL